MDNFEDFLATESRALTVHLDEIRTLGDEIGGCSYADAVARLDSACAFCRDELIPRLDLHEIHLDAVIKAALGGLDVTRPLVVERGRLRGLATALDGRRRDCTFEPTDRLALRRELYLLHAIAGVYLARQRALYLPLLRSRVDLVAQEAVVRRLRADSPRGARPG